MPGHTAGWGGGTRAAPGFGEGPQHDHTPTPSGGPEHRGGGHAALASRGTQGFLRHGAWAGPTEEEAGLRPVEQRWAARAGQGGHSTDAPTPPFWLLGAQQPALEPLPEQPCDRDPGQACVNPDCTSPRGLALSPPACFPLERGRYQGYREIPGTQLRTVVSSSLSQGRRGILGHEQPPGLVVLNPSPCPSPTGWGGHSRTLLCVCSLWGFGGRSRARQGWYLWASPTPRSSLGYQDILPLPAPATVAAQARPPGAHESLRTPELADTACRLVFVQAGLRRRLGCGRHNAPLLPGR